MQRIRNKRLQKRYIDFSVAAFNIKPTHILFGNTCLFNYYNLVGYKYYLTGRANNVL